MDVESKKNKDPIRISINLDDEKFDEIGGKYTFWGKLPVQVLSESGDKAHTIFESYRVDATLEVYEKFKAIRERCRSDPWGYGHEVIAFLDLYELSFKHNAYTTGYFFRLIDVEPVTYDDNDENDNVSNKWN